MTNARDRALAPPTATPPIGATRGALTPAEIDEYHNHCFLKTRYQARPGAAGEPVRRRRAGDRREAELDEERAVDVYMQAGQVPLLDVYLMHGANPNRSPTAGRRWRSATCPGRATSTRRSFRRGRCDRA